MAYLIAILVSLALFSGFLALTYAEQKRSFRLFASARGRLDMRAQQLSFILAHVDFAGFLHEEAVRLGQKAAHSSVVHALSTVRAAERKLTQAVRHIRSYQKPLGPAEPPREYVQALSHFKGGLTRKHSQTSHT